jgi:hypothetical protein
MNQPTFNSNWMGFGTSSPSNGQFWYGSTVNFPGFTYKKKMAGGTRKSTKFGPGGNLGCNKEIYLYNKYRPGTGGIGATSTSVRRSKNRIASICQNNQCGAFYTYLGRYDKYTSNPNGYFPYPQQSSGTYISPATLSSFGPSTHRFF